ncbi:MAG: outer membrane lipoprotein carrier protein LolA [Cytophagaceae bacterium]|jgi:outer membrane lipoprotein-sorting protein|nr:outer membrane lipoprotein carrier protein LolA [Cytophagaceae bacterium]
MKKTITTGIVFIAWVFLAIAQYDPKAQAILDEMSNKFKTYTSYKATFTYSMNNTAAGVKEPEVKGDITVKGNKYKLTLPKQEIFNNGTTVWTYMKDVNEVNISTYDPNEDDMSPSKIYTMYKKGYKYIYVGDKTVGSTVHQMIELVPEDRKNRFSKVKLEISKTDKSIKNWKLFEKNGNIYEYKVTTFTPNVAVDDATFSFNKAKYPNVTEIDLR